MSNGLQKKSEHAFLVHIVNSFLGVKNDGPPNYVDWNSVANRIISEGLAGICYEVLLKEKRDVPEWLEQLFRFHYYDNVARFIQCEKSLCNLLNSVKVPMVLLKGLALIPRFYGSAGLRSFSDIDILIRSADNMRFNKQLKRTGYQRDENSLDLYTDDGMILDVHTDLFGTARIQSRKLAVKMSPEIPWTRTRYFTFAGKNVLCLEPELEILFLCYHMVKHSFLKLIWAVDIAKIFLTFQNKFRWNYFARLSAESNLNVFSYYGLHFVNEIVKGLVPEAILGELLSFQPNALQTSMYRAATQGHKVHQFAELFFISSIHSNERKLAFIKEVAFPAAQVKKQIFRGYKFPLLKIVFYPMRVFQILRIGLNWALSLLRNYSFRLSYKFSE